MDDSPRMRASDEDRQRVAAALDHAFTHGQLDYAEFDERTRRVWASTHRDELLIQLGDLFPDPSRIIDHGLPVPAIVASRQITAQPGGDALTFALMGGAERKGNWLCSPTHTAVVVMGGAEIDLRHARLGAQETVITAVAVMGGIEIIVPEDVRVVSDGIGLLGGFGVGNHPSADPEQGRLPADAPVIRIRGLAFMGGVEILRKARGAR